MMQWGLPCSASCCRAGKGTQCDLIVKEYGWAHFSAGDLLRAQVKAGTEMVREQHTCSPPRAYAQAPAAAEPVCCCRIAGQEGRGVPQGRHHGASQHDHR